MLDKMMKSLAETLGIGPFIAGENGAYTIEVDQLTLTIKQHSSWILWETALPLRFNEHLNYQQEQALKTLYAAITKNASRYAKRAHHKR